MQTCIMYNNIHVSNVLPIHQHITVFMYHCTSNTSLLYSLSFPILSHMSYTYQWSNVSHSTDIHISIYHINNHSMIKYQYPYTYTHVRFHSHIISHSSTQFTHIGFSHLTMLQDLSVVVVLDSSLCILYDLVQVNASFSWIPSSICM